MKVETLILGAGAAGLMCAAHAGPSTLLIDHAKAPGEKIRISGGGRCNFTNLWIEPQKFLGKNAHFHKSALARYTQWDFIELVERHKIPWHEKTLGQLFCDTTAKDIIAMLLAEVAAAGADLWLKTEVISVMRAGDLFQATLEKDGKRTMVTARNLVVATGGKSIPKMGATGLAYRIAEDFGHSVTETRPGLVPFTFGDSLDDLKTLAGVSVPGRVTVGGVSFDEAVLFTHRGLSGPAALQASSYWQDGGEIGVDLCPETRLGPALAAAKRDKGRRSMVSALSDVLPARLAEVMADRLGLSGNLADQSDAALVVAGDAINDWRLKPTATEGYRTAEVTLGGVGTDALSSTSMMSKSVPGLYFIGEAVDVTGWLGGYNFQWAWSSGWASGTAIRQAGKV